MDESLSTSLNSLAELLEKCKVLIWIHYLGNNKKVKFDENKERLHLYIILYSIKNSIQHVTADIVRTIAYEYFILSF